MGIVNKEIEPKIVSKSELENWSLKILSMANDAHFHAVLAGKEITMHCLQNCGGGEAIQ